MDKLVHLLLDIDKHAWCHRGHRTADLAYMC